MSAKYIHIADELRAQILSIKNVKPQKLPTEQELCDKYHVSRQTIRSSLLLLEEEHLIHRIQGSGAYITPQEEYIASKKIVLLLSEDSEYTYPGLISDVEAVLRTKNLRLTVSTMRSDVNIERNILQQLLSESISVLVVEATRTVFSPNTDLYEKLQLQGTHILFIGSTPSLAHPANVISIDHAEGGRLLGNCLITQSLRSIYALLPDFIDDAKERYLGLQIAFREKGLPIPFENIYWYTNKQLQLLRAKKDTSFFLPLIRNQLTDCDAIFCYNDEIAYSLIKELTYAGISVPEQVSVISFDNSYLCSISVPMITSVGLPFHEPGYSVGNAIVDLIFENSTKNKTLPWELHLRGSVLSTNYS
ncbi:MAG: GntR family transcriptional regulator [Lachnospiraceae bacterium]|nr:GntR family transcriptional regulator [Lachnospiraceae bacterium]